VEDLAQEEVEDKVQVDLQEALVVLVVLVVLEALGAQVLTLTVPGMALEAVTAIRLAGKEEESSMMEKVIKRKRNHQRNQ